MIRNPIDEQAWSTSRATVSWSFAEPLRKGPMSITGMLFISPTPHLDQYSLDDDSRASINFALFRRFGKTGRRAAVAVTLDSPCSIWPSMGNGRARARILIAYPRKPTFACAAISVAMG